MKKALVRRDLKRLFQVEDAPFPVAPPMEWIDCADDVRPETHEFDGSAFALKLPAPSVPVIDLSNIDNLEKSFKALALVMRDYCNQLKLGAFTGAGAGGTKTVAEIRADFAAKYNSLA